MPRIALRAHAVVARPQQVADRLVLGLWHPDGAQFARPR